MQSYLEIGRFLGPTAGAITFISAYVYCIGHYGFLLGGGLGWLPSGILAGIVGLAVTRLWGLVAGLLLLALIYLSIISAK